MSSVDDRLDRLEKEFEALRDATASAFNRLEDDEKAKFSDFLWKERYDRGLLFRVVG